MAGDIHKVKMYDFAAWHGVDSPVLELLGSNPFALLTYSITSHFYFSGSEVPQHAKENPSIRSLIELVGF